MKKNVFKLLFVINILCCFVISGCEEKDNVVVSGVPTLSIPDISIITMAFGYCDCAITSQGDSPVTAAGVCWSTTSTEPTLDDNFYPNGGSGSASSFSNNLFGGYFNQLSSNVVYYFRSYATNTEGTGYSPVITFRTPSGTTDYDSNTYTSVIIGTQEWLVENLKVINYNDGTAISNVTDNASWEALTTDAYCWYNNSISNKVDYGALYNWYAVNSGKLAPTGWHIPTDTEWETLISFVGGESVAGGRLKESSFAHWNSPNVGQGDAFFFALPGGKRGNSTVGDGEFLRMGTDGYWWSSTEKSTGDAWERNMGNGTVYVYSYGDKKSYGLSVRCIKD